ncbi:hypothetical protein ACFL6G_06375 [candidate division KSB1 bacterium]
MLKILKAEINYNKANLALMFLFLLMLSGSSFIRFFAAIIILYVMNSVRNKELRERRLAILPVGINNPAIARVLFFALPFLIYTLLTLIVLAIIRPDELELINRLLIGNGIIIGGFSVYFIVRDLFLDFFRRLGFTKKKSVIIFMVIIVFFNLLGVYTMIALQKEFPNPVEDIIKFIRVSILPNNPFAGEYGSLYFLICSMILGFGTIISYSKRKSFLE